MVIKNVFFYLDIICPDKKTFFILKFHQVITNAFKNRHYFYTTFSYNNWVSYSRLEDTNTDAIDVHDSIYRLMQTTSGRWREGLMFLLNDCKDEECTRKTLHFVYTNVRTCVSIPCPHPTHKQYPIAISSFCYYGNQYT